MVSIILVLAALTCAVQALRARRLLLSALWLAALSALLATLLYGLGAAQVAVIELSVGAGLVTVLFVFAINLIGEPPANPRPALPMALAITLALVPVVLLGLLALPMPLPAAIESEGSFAITLWQERGVDVVVQVVLIFAGALGLLGLLAEVEAPLRQPAAKEAAAVRDRDLQVLEQAVRHEEVEV
jgi:uncharacterized MnhB-related membrane protein